MKIVSKDVSKVYKIKKGLFGSYDVNVIDGFNYCVDQGEIIGLVGEEGSGKSTIVKLLSGGIKPTSGDILVDGEVNYKKLKDASAVISDVKEIKLISDSSVYNNLFYFGKKHGVDELILEKNISIFKEIFELDKVINKKVSDLNNLDLIKVNLVISMIKNVSILFFDSALTDLTVVEKNNVLKMLKRLNKEYKTTIVVSSNDIVDVEKICKRMTILKKGKIVKDGAFSELKKELFNEKEVTIVFNKGANLPKGNFEVIEHGDYMLKIKIDFEKCDFASLINQFDVNTIVDINISNVGISEV